MKKKITFIEVLIIIIVIVVVVKGYRFWNKPEEVPEVTPVPTEVSIEEPTPEEKSVTPSFLSTSGIEKPVTSPPPTIIPEMVLIKGGKFQMGSDNAYDTKPVHTVEVSSFYIGKYEVTNGEYIEFLNIMGNHLKFKKTCIGMTFVPGGTGKLDGSYQVKSGYENRPVVYASWYEAVAYCNWLSEQEGFTPVYGMDSDSEDPATWLTKDGYRLPTEVEWEYACRAGTDSNFYWGDETDVSVMGQYCWYSGNFDNSYHNVGMKLPNKFGLFDMIGNVREWCSDWYKWDYYQDCINNNININPPGPLSGKFRIIRGGNRSTFPIGCQSSSRSSGHFDAQFYGFRLCRSAP